MGRSIRFSSKRSVITPKREPEIIKQAGSFEAFNQALQLIGPLVRYKTRPNWKLRRRQREEGRLFWYKCYKKNMFDIDWIMILLKVLISM